MFHVPDDLVSVLYGGLVITYRQFDFWILRTVAKLDTTIAGQIESMKHCGNDIVNNSEERLFATTLADVKARVLSRSVLLPVAPLSHETPPLTKLWACNHKSKYTRLCTSPMTTWIEIITSSLFEQA